MPLETNVFVIYGLTLTAFGSGLQFAHNFQSILPPAPAPGNTELWLYEPKQYFFNDIQFENEIRVAVDFQNTSAGQTYLISSSVIIETRE